MLLLQVRKEERLHADVQRTQCPPPGASSVTCPAPAAPPVPGSAGPVFSLVPAEFLEPAGRFRAGSRKRERQVETLV